MKSQITHKQQSTPEEKLMIFFFLSMIGGVILSCVFFFLAVNGRFQRWEVVGKVPGNTAQVINGTDLRVYIRTSENKTLSCAMYDPDECWISDIEPTDTTTQTCSKEHQAFSSLKIQPNNIASCIQVRSGYDEWEDNLVFLIDQDFNLWRWALERGGGETPTLILMAMMGGGGGVLIGSILWVVIRLIRRKRLSREREQPLFSIAHIGLLATPWVCLFSFLAFAFLVNRLNDLSLPGFAAVETEIASTKAAEKTEVANEFLAPVTPEPGGIRYSFSKLACNAEWSSDNKPIPCVSGSSKETAVVIQPISTVQGKQIEGQAILMPTSLFEYIRGEFPAITIQEGDYFRATVACVEKTPDCNLKFVVYLRLGYQSSVRLGTWKPVGENSIEEINVDLSKFAGKTVRFSFNLLSDDYKSIGNQNVVWILPRIEK